MPAKSYLPHVGAVTVDAGETVAFEQFLVRLAGKRRKITAGYNRIREELVR